MKVMSQHGFSQQKDEWKKTEEKPSKVSWERGSGVKGDALVTSVLPGARASCSRDAGEDTVTSKHPLSGAKAAVITRRKPPLCYKICLRKQDTLGFCK